MTMPAMAPPDRPCLGELEAPSDTSVLDGVIDDIRSVSNVLGAGVGANVAGAGVGAHDMLPMPSVERVNGACAQMASESTHLPPI